MIIAGEASGDLHAAKLIRAIHAKQSDIHFYGIGGDHMAQAGAEVHVNSRDMAVVGLVEIWAQRKLIFGALDKMKQSIAAQPPDLLILVDYPEFNLRLAKFAKQHGVKVLFYISPQIWAWRQHRVKKIKQRVDMMAVVFPFEEIFYKKHDVPVQFVGHPLVDEVKASADQASLRTEFGINTDKLTIGLFPGSRRSEIKRLLVTILESARCIKQQHPDCQFLLPLAHTLDTTDIETALTDYADLNIRTVQHRSYDVMEACDLILTVSGTVTLEIALMKKPMVIINRVAWLTYQLVHRMLKIDHIGLCNIVADKRIAPELIQYDATPEKICETMNTLIHDQNARQTMQMELAKIEGLLGARGGIDNMATLTLQMLEN